MKKYQLEDVTKAMFLIMKNAKAYGHKRAAEFLSTRRSLDEFDKRAGIIGSIIILPELYNEIMEFYDFMMHDFVDLVATGAVYDIKIQYAFKRQQQYYFDGMVIDYDDTGNILYGVYGKALVTDVIDYYIKLAEILHDNNFLDSIYFLVGLVFPHLDGFEIKKLSGAFINYFSQPELTSEEILHIGAGIYNIRSAIEGADGDIEELNKVIKREFGWLKNYLGDDPRDYEAVELGYKYYDKV